MKEKPTGTEYPPVFDGHNDTLMRLFITGSDDGRLFLNGGPEGHLDLPRARLGGFGGGLFAIMTPPADMPPEPAAPVQNYDLPEFPELNTAAACPGVMRAMAGLYRLEAASGGLVAVVRSPADVRVCLSSGVLAAGIHFEGAEPIDPELNALQVYYQAGLRSLGIVWSRPNAFGHGVPIRFPGLPDTGPGLTVAGRDLVTECNRLGILVDVSHLNYQGFMDVAKLSSRPIVATHSNAHAICPCSRNLTDEQLDIIGASGGLAGINFAVGFLRPDGLPDGNMPLDGIADHIEYIARRIGMDHVALGSDFDGAGISDELGDVAGLPKLFDCLAGRGFSASDLEKIAHQNWLRVLDAAWTTGERRLGGDAE